MLARILAFLAGAFFIVGPAAAEALQPTSEWTVKAAGNECLLSRAYGTPKDPLFLVFTKAPMWPGLTETVLRASKNTNFRNGRATVTFLGSPTAEGRFDAKLLTVNPKTGLKVKTMRCIWIGADEGEISPSVASVAIEAEGEIKETFALPDFAEARRKLDDCATAMAVSWGFSVEEQRRLAKPPEAVDGFASLFSEKDYPESAVRDGVRGRVRVKVPISAAGEPMGCEVVVGSGSSELDDTTCRIILKRAKFEPALDVDGKPVRSVYVQTIGWILG